MNRRQWLLIGCVAAMLVVSGCGEKSKNGVSAPDQETNAQFKAEQTDQRIVSANNRFGLTLYNELLQSEKKNSNIVISPSSISIALAMAYNGADAETKKEMESVLRLNGMTLQDINAGNEVLKDVLEHVDSAVEVNIANSLWVKSGKTFHESFLNDVQRFYHAELNAVDFMKESTADQINGWVSDATKGKIEQIVEKPIDPATIMILLNAIYFKGEWDVPFDENATADRTFTAMTGQSLNVPMMNRNGEFLYKQTDGYQAIRLPYGSGAYRMNVYLPAEDSDLNALADKLSSSSDELSKGFSQSEGTFSLPRFTSQYSIKLNDALETIGMREAFDETKANFSKMAPIPPNLSISKVQHKTYIEVNEKGTEAAAVTSVEVVETAGVADSERFVMEVNRPFFFTIEESKTGTLLFMGSITNPLAEE